MIVDKRNWLELTLLTWRGSVLPRIWVRLTLTTLLASAVTVLHEFYGWFSISLTPLPFTLVGLALSIFLGFRNNASYDRFWEGRKLWGSLVNGSRTSARQITAWVGTRNVEHREAVESHEASALQQNLIHLLIANAHALRLHLRGQPADDALARCIEDESLRATIGNEPNAPLAILFAMSARLRAAWARGWLDTYHFGVLEQGLAELTSIQGACERIRNTPMPFNYTVLIHQLVVFYCVGLPFGITDAVGVLTPLVVFMICYALYGLDAIGDELEDPFGLEENDLPLSTLCNTIERDLRHRLGEKDLPAALAPKAGVLD